MCTIQSFSAHQSIYKIQCHPLLSVCPLKINQCLLLKMDCSKVEGYIIAHISSNITHTANKVKKNGLQSHLLPPAEQLTAFLMLIATASKQETSLLCLLVNRNISVAHNTGGSNQSQTERRHHDLKDTGFGMVVFHFETSVSVLLKDQIQHFTIKTGRLLCDKIFTWLFLQPKPLVSLALRQSSHIKLIPY